MALGGKNVMVPLALLERIIELLGYWDTSRYDRAVCDDYDCILQELNLKIHKLELREAYAMIVQSKDGDARRSARIRYQWLKSLIG